MNKNLAVIQKISQVAQVVCRVLFVCCIVGAAISLVGAISAAFIEADELFKVGNVTFYGIVVEGTMTTAQVVTVLISTIVFLAPAAVLMKAAENYFAFELKEGTPFTVEGAERIKKLGIMTIVLPMASEIIVQIIVAATANSSSAEITSGGSIITGLLLIFLHFVFKYGAEIAPNAAQNAATNAPATVAENENK